jgi:hypothetical protein
MDSSLEIELTAVAESVMYQFVDFFGARFQIFGYIQSEMVDDLLKVAFLAKEHHKTADYIIEHLDDGDPENLNMAWIDDPDNDERYFLQVQERVARAGVETNRITDNAIVPMDEYIFMCIISKVQMSNDKLIPFYGKSKIVWDALSVGKLLHTSKALPFESEPNPI